jgi:hypothetical protein
MRGARGDLGRWANERIRDPNRQERPFRFGCLQAGVDRLAAFRGGLAGSQHERERTPSERSHLPIL